MEGGVRGRRRGRRDREICGSCVGSNIHCRISRWPLDRRFMITNETSLGLTILLYMRKITFWTFGLTFVAPLLPNPYRVRIQRSHNFYYYLFYCYYCCNKGRCSINEWVNWRENGTEFFPFFISQYKSWFFFCSYYFYISSSFCCVLFTRIDSFIYNSFIVFLFFIALAHFSHNYFLSLFLLL